MFCALQKPAPWGIFSSPHISPCNGQAAAFLSGFSLADELWKHTDFMVMVHCSVTCMPTFDSSLQEHESYTKVLPAMKDSLFPLFHHLLCCLGAGRPSSHNTCWTAASTRAGHQHAALIVSGCCQSIVSCATATPLVLWIWMCVFLCPLRTKDAS